MKMTSDRKLLLISFIKLLKYCKNQFSKCCSVAEFKKWHQFLCEDDLWSKIVTNKFVRLIKYCKNQFSKCCFFAEFKKMTSVSLWWFAVLITEMEIKFRKKVTFENWFLQYLTSLTNLLVTIFDQRSSSQINWCHFLNSAKKQHFENLFLQNFKSLTLWVPGGSF